MTYSGPNGASGVDRRQVLLTAAAFAALGGHAAAQTADPAALEALIKAAKQEGNVVLDGPPQDEVREAVTTAFKAKYGITVSYISSGSSRSAARVRAERAAGRYLLDVFISGPDTPLFSFRPAGWLDPIAPALVDPEVTDNSKWFNNQLLFVDPDRYLLRMLRFVTPTIAINTKVVQRGEITTWKDIIDPKWRGKIIAKDPSVHGAGASVTSYLYIALGPEFVKSLYVDQKPTISRDSRQAGQSLAVGTNAIWVGPDNPEVVRFRGLGYPIEWVTPSDAPGIVSGGWGVLGLINKAPNPNAAKLLVNWLMSRDGMTTFARASKAMSLRTDIDQPWVEDYQKPQPGKEYMDTYDYRFVFEQRDTAFENVKKLLNL
jgi:iron(III) transport system substrate-binding protein